MSDDSALVQVLRAHHTPIRRIARLIEKQGRKLRAESRRRGVEVAAMLDADRGLPVGSAISGTENEVNILRHLQAVEARPGDFFVQIHTHPHSLSFSDRDLVLLADSRQIVALVVAGADGTWYVLSKTAAYTLPPTKQGSQEAFRALWDAMEDVAAAAGAVETDDRERRHLAFERAAPALGLRYDRVNPEGRSEDEK